MFSRRRAAVAAAAVVLGAGITAQVYTRRGQTHSPANSETGYVNAAVCTGCHADRAAGFHKTGMGRSFAKLRPERVPEFGKPFHNSASDSYFTMAARDGKYFQRRWQTGFDGKGTQCRRRNKVDYASSAREIIRTRICISQSRGALHGPAAEPGIPRRAVIGT